MSMSDPVADMLTRIRNAHIAGKFQVKIPGSSLKLAIANVLKDEGYVGSVQASASGVKHSIEIELKYFEGKAVIEQIDRVSKPGRRVYKSASDLPKVDGGLGVAIVSTSKGVMSDSKARAAGLGGEVICYVA